MDIAIDIILKAGRSAVELSLFILLPVMVVMLSIMRYLESKGALDWLAHRLAPLLKPFGLTGFGIFAMLQVNLVSFAAPVATLAMMEQRGVSNRQLAATLAMVLAMSQANVTFPMAALGLKIGLLLAISVLGGLVAAAVTWYGFARALPAEDHVVDESLHAPQTKPQGLLDVINHAGAEAFRIATGAIPMLLLSLVVVTSLRISGSIDALTRLTAPFFAMLSIDTAFLLPALTKYLGGGTAMLGVMEEMMRHGQMSAEAFNKAAGFLIHPLDIPGVAVLISAGKRVAGVWKPALLGGLVGVLFRTAGHLLLA
ncbi:MAG: nucleoside recognition domain-containing protein [Betaproteobacteria bacterium]